MRKMGALIFATVLAFLISGPASADTITHDKLWGFQYINPSNPATELAYMASILGPGVYTDYTFYKIEDDSVKGKTNYSYNPGFVWDYALVKVDGPNDYSYLFQDDYPAPGGNDILETGMDFRYDVSHISFLRPKAVSEPSTLVLLGIGLMTMGGLLRGKKIKN